jgi:hypothetical protein
MSTKILYFDNSADFQPFNPQEISFSLDALSLVNSEIQATFTDLVNVTASNGMIQKTGGVNDDWDAGCISIQTITSEGFLEFMAGQTNCGFICGLSNTNPSPSYLDVQYGLLFQANGNLQIYESGVLIGAFGTYTINDIFHVMVISGQIIYHKNGITLYTSLVTPTLPLFLDCSLFTSNAIIKNCVISNELTPYPTTSPSVIRTSLLYLTAFTSFTVQATIPMNTSVSWNLIIDGFLYYWNGSAWVISNGTLGQSNTETEINSNLSSFDFSSGHTVSFKTYLTSDGENTPIVMSQTMEVMSFLPKPAEPTLCHLVGYVENIIGTIPPDFVLKASPVIPYYNGSANVLVGFKSFYPRVVGPTGVVPASAVQPASGYLDVPLRETITTGQVVQFKMQYTLDGIFREVLFYPVQIPDQDQALISDLLIPVLST